MNKTIEEQLKMLSKTLGFQVDGKLSKEIPSFFNEIVFFRNSKESASNENHIIVFEDYILKGNIADDFHSKFNKGVLPPEKIMVGYVVKESEKMFYLRLSNSNKTMFWEGWCPKKSVKFEN